MYPTSDPTPDLTPDPTPSPSPSPSSTGKTKLAKDPRDEEAAKQRERDRNREEGRKKKCVDMDEAELAKDEAVIEEQCPGVMQNFALWQASDGYAMRGRVHLCSFVFVFH